MNNKYTLNPNSYLVVKRWDFYAPQTIKLYEEKMREAISRLQFDAKKVKDFKEKTLKGWK